MTLMTPSEQGRAIFSLFSGHIDTVALERLELHIALEDARHTSPIQDAIRNLRRLQGSAPALTEQAYALISSDYRQIQREVSALMTPICTPEAYTHARALEALKSFVPTPRNDAALLTQLEAELAPLDAQEEHRYDPREVLAKYLWARQSESARTEAAAPLLTRQNALKDQVAHAYADMRTVQEQLYRTYWISEDDLDRYYCRQDPRPGEPELVSSYATAEAQYRALVSVLEPLRLRLNRIQG